MHKVRCTNTNINSTVTAQYIGSSVCRSIHSTKRKTSASVLNSINVFAFPSFLFYFFYICIYYTLSFYKCQPHFLKKHIIPLHLSNLYKKSGLILPLFFYDIFFPFPFFLFSMGFSFPPISSKIVSSSEPFISSGLTSPILV